MTTSTDSKITRTQVSIALAKLYAGTRPGDEMWGELDCQALEFSLGHPVDRKYPYREAMLQKGQALVLVGEQGCGKSTMARAIAAQYGSFLEVDSSIFADVFAVGSVLAREVSTLIVEEIPRNTQFLLGIKALLANETVLCHQKGQVEKYVKSPNLIFCTGDISPIKDLGVDDRRFRIVHMGVDLTCASEAIEKPLTDPEKTVFIVFNEQGRPEYVEAWEDACHEFINENCEHNPDAGKWVVRSAYLEA